VGTKIRVTIKEALKDGTTAFQLWHQHEPPAGDIKALTGERAPGTSKTLTFVTSQFSLFGVSYLVPAKTPDNGGNGGSGGSSGAGGSGGGSGTGADGGSGDGSGAGGADGSGGADDVAGSGSGVDGDGAAGAGGAGDGTDVNGVAGAYGADGSDVDADGYIVGTGTVPVTLWLVLLIGLLGVAVRTVRTLRG
jgi:hypothetical protein